MNPAAPLPPAEPLGPRILRTVARVVLATLVTFLALLAIVSMSALAQKEVSAMLGWGDSELARSRALVWVGIVPVLVVSLLSWLGRRLSWRSLALGYGAVVPVFVYLAWDEAALRRPLTVEEVTPSFPGAEASYAVLMRYGKQHPGGRDFRGSHLNWVGHDREKPERWLKHITEKRSVIEAEWQALAPLRAWLVELNAFDRIGDLTSPGPDSEILAFQPVRELSQRVCAVAALQALDGKGDEAIETLLPLLEVSRKLQPSARTLVHQMIAIVIEKMTMQTADFVLDHARVSPGVRARLKAVLAVPGGGETGARRLLSCEYVGTVNYYSSRPLGAIVADGDRLPAVRLVLNALSPFVYNRRATFNLYADLMADNEALAGRRQVQQLQARQEKFFKHDAKPGFKNLMGILLIGQLTPSYGKVTESYWKTQDERAALLARVTAP